ncbi:hypothetical protein [Arthrobacter oryzae]|nr:hypothetical protein [Arthrobacter oryzae]
MQGITGEAVQAKGADGARRAKRWLESTTRVNAQWVNPDPPALAKLTFSWPHGGQTFSFDLGGTLKYGDLEGEMFFAESKNYAKASDLPTHYEKYLAQCYVAYLDKPGYCDHFMWIAWSPHGTTTWDTLLTAEAVQAAVVRHRKNVFGVELVKDAESLVDFTTCKEVAMRLWMIILSERQEKLVISPEHRGVIEKYEITKAG